VVNFYAFERSFSSRFCRGILSQLWLWGVGTIPSHSSGKKLGKSTFGRIAQEIRESKI